MEDEINQQTDTLPGLSQGHPLGKVLANRNESSRKTELVIFIRPVIIKDARLQADYRDYRASLPGEDFFNRTADGGRSR